ncbi:hypothetical protein IV203_013624 [Nitzschia inconspicua]|uniref:Uncharacterized protein n=1 Tax=Nitzschia inconspicua TaxID=303405 RepID=A0A9K3M5X9_9STRA|nr:hypothetical protein IV203_013624 [Nitzschia inconspicua]
MDSNVTFQRILVQALPPLWLAHHSPRMEAACRFSRQKRGSQRNSQKNQKLAIFLHEVHRNIGRIQSFKGSPLIILCEFRGGSESDWRQQR